MKIFITGIAGFLGSHLARRMLELGHEVGGNDNMLGGDKENLPKNVNFFEIDFSISIFLLASLRSLFVRIKFLISAI